MAATTHPILRAHLGKPLSRVIADSAYAFDPARLASMRDRAPWVVEGPSQLVYDDREIGFEVPPGRYLWISVAAGRVFELTAGATEAALTLDDAYERARQIERTLAALPFTKRGEMRRTYPELAEEIAELTRDGYEVDLLRHEKGAVRAALTLKWLGSAAPSRREAFILTMCWSSPALEDELMDKVREKRREHGDESAALPMSAWMGDAGSAVE